MKFKFLKSINNILVIALLANIFVVVSLSSMNESNLPNEHEVQEEAASQNLLLHFLLNPSALLENPMLKPYIDKVAPEGSPLHQALECCKIPGQYGVTAEKVMSSINMIPSFDTAKNFSSLIIPSVDSVVDTGVNAGEKVMDGIERLYNLPKEFEDLVQGKAFLENDKKNRRSNWIKEKLLCKVPLGSLTENYEGKAEVNVFTSGDDSKFNVGSLSVGILGNDFLRLAFHLARFGVDKIFFDKFQKAFIKNATNNIKIKKNSLIEALDEIPRDVDGSLIWDQALKKKYVAQCLDILAPNQQQRSRLLAMATVYLIASESLKYTDRSFAQKSNVRDVTEGWLYFADVESRRHVEREIENIPWTKDPLSDNFQATDVSGHVWVKDNSGKILSMDGIENPFEFFNNRPELYSLTPEENSGVTVPLIPRFLYANTAKKNAFTVTPMMSIIEMISGWIIGRDPLLMVSPLPKVRQWSLWLAGWNYDFLNSDTFYCLKRIAMLSYLFTKTTAWLKDNTKTMLEKNFDEFCDHINMLAVSDALTQEEVVGLENSFKHFITSSLYSSSREWILFKHQTLRQAEFVIEMTLMLPVFIKVARMLPSAYRMTKELYGML